MELNMLGEEQLQSSLFDCFQDPITSIPPLDASSPYVQSLATDCIVDPDFYLEQHDSLSPFPASLEQYYDDLSDYSLVPLQDLSDRHSDYPIVPLPDLSVQRFDHFSPDPPLDLSPLSTLTQECCNYINTQLESAAVVDSFLLLDNDGCYTQDIADQSEDSRGIRRSKSAREISLEGLRGFFCMPITKAAKEMNAGLTMLGEEQLQSSLFDCFQDPITSIPPLDASSPYVQSLATDCIVDPDFYLEQHDSLSPFPPALEQYYNDLSDYSLVPLPDLPDRHSNYPIVPLPDLSVQQVDHFSPDPPLDLSPLSTLTQECCYYINTHLESAAAVDSFLLLDNDRCYTQDIADRSKDSRRIRQSKSVREISLEEVRGYFCMPITKAAKEMNVGVTVLKKRCRELGIPRWPHRKMKSLRKLISNVRELGKDDEDINRELETLDEYRRQMEEHPEIQFTDRTKKLRQACFKANYKKRRLIQDQSFDRNAVHKWITCQVPSSSSSSCD